MSSPASIRNHPIHPMFVAIPLGLWIFALVCDIVRACGGGATWNTVALYSTAGGIAGAILAAVPGFMDYLSINEAKMKKIATTHLLLGLGAIIIFSMDLWSRLRLSPESKVPLLLSGVGVLMIGFGGWLGGEMVYVKGMAVQAVEKLAEKEKKQPRLRRAS